jgi:hypothetical protein
LKSDRRSLGVLLSATFLSLSGDAITQLGVPWLVLLDTGSTDRADPGPGMERGDLADRLPRWLVFTLGCIIVGMPRFAVAALTGTPAR